MKINNLFLALTISGIFIIGIIASDLLGYWETESSRIPQKITEGEFEGSYNPEDIRGSYSFGDIENSFDIDSEILSKAYNLDGIIGNPDSFILNQLEDFYEFEEDVEIGTGSIKFFVSLYAGIPYESDDNELPTTAVEILKEKGKIDEEMYIELKEISIDISKYLKKDNIESDKSSEEDEEYIIKATTRVIEVLRWGISIEELEELMGLKEISEDDIIRELCLDNELSFSEIKEKIFNTIE